MSKLCLVFVLLLTLAITGCASKPTGSQQYIPGKGWVPSE